MFPNVDFYEGEFRDDEFNGQGIMEWLSRGITYDG